MKKIFTFAAFLLATMSMQAKEYEGTLAISINGEEPLEQKSSISVDKQTDGTYTLTLKNFNLGGEMAVGTIKVENVKATAINGGASALTFKGNNTILPNDDNEGMMANEEVPLDIKGFINSKGFNTTINIDLGDMFVAVMFTPNTVEGTQIPNSDFETFHTATHTYNKKDYKGTEPDHWHGFNSGLNTATGWSVGVIDVALQGDQAHESTDVRPGSTGSKSLLLESNGLSIASANGTITTGRLHAGSSTATNTANCSYMDITDEAVDDHNDPFYTTLSAKPDAVNVWLKYKVGARDNKNKNYVYATVSAVITDGTKYQDPEDTTYENYAAKAQDKKIGGTNGEWKNVTVPFKYEENNVTPKAILVTMSTCAQPGGGSKDNNDKDQLYIDDFSLVYNSELTSLTYKGFDYAYKSTICADENVTADDFTITSNGQGAFINKEIEEDENGKRLVVSISANDFSNINLYSYDLVDASSKTETFTTMDYGWATYTPSIAVKFPTDENVKAYCVALSEETQNNIQTTEINGIVPAGTPLLLRAEKQGKKEYTLQGSNDTPVKVTTSLNSAEGDGSEWEKDQAQTLYVLSNGNNGVGFYKLKQDTKIPAGKCYLDIRPASHAASFLSLDGTGNGTTAIDHIENAADANTNAAQPLYNLAGQKVNAQYKGIVIKGGKKMVIK